MIEFKFFLHNNISVAGRKTTSTYIFHPPRKNYIDIPGDSSLVTEIFGAWEKDNEKKKE